MTPEAPDPARDLVREALSELGQRLGEAVKARSLPKAGMKQARRLLREAWGWEQDPDAPLWRGQSLEREMARLADGPEDGAWSRALAGRLEGMWPLTLRCLDPPRWTITIDRSEEMTDSRARRMQGFLACFGISEDKLPIQVRKTRTYRGLWDSPDLPVVEKKGSR